MKDGRALVLGSCGPGNGAYLAGVTATLCTKLGPDYFNGLYGSSVGVYPITFYASNQPETIKNTWLNLSPGFKLINPLNPLRGKKILDLQYMIDIFQNEKSRLDVKKVFDYKKVLVYTLTDHNSGSAVYVEPNQENIFKYMIASAALPFVHGPVEIDGQKYIYGGLADPLPVVKALNDGWKEIVVVWHRPQNAAVTKTSHLFWNIISRFLPPHLSKLLRTSWKKIETIEGLMETDSRITIICPQKELPIKFTLDNRRSLWIKAFNLGEEDALHFLKTI